MRTVNIGIVGLGRLGKQHAINLINKVSNSNLIAVCSVNDSELKDFQKEFNTKYTFTSFEEMIKLEELDAVVIASSSAYHCDHIQKALAAGLHVFCEKPLGVSLTECKAAEKAVEENPNQVFMLGFMRRFDPSYKYAKEKIISGAIGKPILVRAYSIDPESAIEGTIKFGPTSGGEFVDMGVHDIDIARWMLGCEPKTVYAIGGCYKHPEFASFNDGDNVSALMQFENDTMAFFLAGRTAPHGYHVETEIIGTEATLRIASTPMANHVEILDNHGVRRECSQNFLERFKDAYIAELQEFVDCILNNTTPDVTVYDGTRATIIAQGATKSFQEGVLVKFD